MTAYNEIRIQNTYHQNTQWTSERFQQKGLTERATSAKELLPLVVEDINQQRYVGESMSSLSISTLDGYSYSKEEIPHGFGFQSTSVNCET